MGKTKDDDPSQNRDKRKSKNDTSDKKEAVVGKFLTSLNLIKRNNRSGTSGRKSGTGSGKSYGISNLAVPVGRGGGGSSTSATPNRRPSRSPAGSPKRRSSRAKRSRDSVRSGSSGGSSGGGSEGSLRRRRRHRQAKQKDKKDTLLSRIRDYIAESDVFVTHNAVSPHLTCIRISYISILPFAIIFVWDLLAVLLFEIPHLSTINFPGFVIIFQFVGILFAMYGYAVQFVTTGSSSRYVTMAKFALIGQYILFVGRAIMEFMFEGFRYEEENYIPLPWSLFPRKEATW